jgi:hypothetical protein
VPLPNHQLPRIPYSVKLDNEDNPAPIVNPPTKWYAYYHTADSQTDATASSGQPPIHPYPIGATVPQSCTKQPYYIYYAICSDITQALTGGEITQLNPIPLPNTENSVFEHVLAVGEQCGDKNFKNRNLEGCETIYTFVKVLPETQDYVPIKYTMWLYTGPDGIPSVGSASDVFTPANAGLPIRPNVVMPGYMIKLDWCATAEWLRTVPSLWLTTSFDGITTEVVEVKMLLTPTNHTS